MLIEEYFQRVEHTIAQSCIITSSRLVTDKRSLYIGFIEGTISFLDGSTLRFMEFVNVKTSINRYKYSYHYQGPTETLIFRYDMAPHHRDVTTFPHHKHFANGHVIDSKAPALREVLEEIDRMVE